jgi:hypothetical protein
MYAVKTGLLVQGIVNLFLPSAPIDAATRNHLRSRFVWECAEEYVRNAASKRVKKPIIS